MSKITRWRRGLWAAGQWWSNAWAWMMGQGGSRRFQFQTTQTIVLIFLLLLSLTSAVVRPPLEDYPTSKMLSTFQQNKHNYHVSGGSGSRVVDRRSVIASSRYRPSTLSHTTHCYFNQLCSCKVLHRRIGHDQSTSVDDYGNIDYYDGFPVRDLVNGDHYSSISPSEEDTTEIYQGQFGSVTTEGSSVLPNINGISSADNSNKRNHTSNNSENLPKPSRLKGTGRGRSRSHGRGRGSFFERMSKNVQDIICVGVPFTTVPDFPAKQVKNMDIIDAGLEVLENNMMASSNSIESARFTNNHITHIEADAFRSLSNSLKTLDLSYNSLSSLPLSPLARLNTLTWLNLHGNEIAELEGIDYTNLTNSLNTLFLGSNDITTVPSSFFTSFSRLIWLNIDDNHIKDLPQNCLPPSILTLSLQNNHISKFPLELVDSLPSLTWFILRGNYIENIPTNPLLSVSRHDGGGKRHLDKLDFGENFITSLSSNMFGDTLRVNDLNLDHNYIERIGERSFASVEPRRLYLGKNRINYIDDEAFTGAERNLELIDLDGNQLNNVSHAFSKLKRLSYLYLGNNNITELPMKTFGRLCANLRTLTLSENRIGPTFPKVSLRRCSRLGNLDLSYNMIKQLRPEDFTQWAQDLSSLNLAANLLNSLQARVFRGCPRLRKLSLSFNQLNYLSPDALRDVSSTLENLEMSFALYSGYTAFPSEMIKPLHKLLWLALDNNNIGPAIEPETALYNLGELQYLNLESNRLVKLPPNVLHHNVHKKLLDVRLSFNYIRKISSGTFHNLKNLKSIMLSGNAIKTVQSYAFKSLPNLETLLLNGNMIDSIESLAFSGLTNIHKIELQNNRLRELSMDVFHNCTIRTATPEEATLLLNISHNKIVHLNPPSTSGGLLNRPPFIRILDASHNSMLEVPQNFLDFLAPALRSLDLSHNSITGRVHEQAFSLLGVVQILSLSHNNIEDLSKPSLLPLSSLQLLDLSFNRIKVLQFGQFVGLNGLRVVNLSHNKLRSLPRDVFQSTKVESVDLSHNEFVAMPTSALTELSRTIKRLNMSYNQIEHIDSTMFSNIPHLLSLSLRENKLTLLPPNVFVGVPALRTLDLSHNRNLRGDISEMLGFVNRLSHLNLADVGMESLPEDPLPLRDLQSLDLAWNNLSSIYYESIERLSQLRHLDLAGNRFTHLPASCWRHLPYLKSLDVSWNPTRVLTKESFAGLERIQQLTIQNLPDLKRFDADSLAQLTYLTKLHIQSWPTIEKYKFRLGSVVSGLASLRTLSAKILEPSGVLTDQILGAFGPKLKELEITGEALHSITLDAFEGIESQELLLTIKDTNLKELPDGFYNVFKSVVHLSFDLRNNKFETLSVDAFYDTSERPWEQTGTRVIKGGMALQGNPLKCSCENTWLAKWLLRWMRETLQLHTSVVERGQNVQSIVRKITCKSEIITNKKNSRLHQGKPEPEARSTRPEPSDDSDSDSLIPLIPSDVEVYDEFSGAKKIGPESPRASTDLSRKKNEDMRPLIDLANIKNLRKYGYCRAGNSFNHAHSFNKRPTTILGMNSLYFVTILIIVILKMSDVYLLQTTLQHRLSDVALCQIISERNNDLVSEGQSDQRVNYSDNKTDCLQSMTPSTTHSRFVFVQYKMNYSLNSRSALH